MLEKLLDSSGGGPVSDFKTLIITGLSAILAASIPAAISIRSKGPKEIGRIQEIDEVYHKQLIDAKNEASRELEKALAELTIAKATIQRLQQFLMQSGFDPYSLAKIERSK